MAKARRPFDPQVLAELGKSAIKPPIGIGAVVWRYTILIPTEETKYGKKTIRIATVEDLENLETSLTKHFDGLTILPPSVGYGLRGSQIELNKHLAFIVYAAASTLSELYFQALRQELQDALVQETILVERQEVWLQ